MVKIIHQIIISDSKSKIIPNNYENINQHFKDFKHIVWDYEKIKKFILKNNDINVLNAIENITPHSYKADIVKYYIIYKIGGWYSDLNNFFVNDVEYFNNDFIFFKDDNIETMSSWAVQPGLFYSIPKNKILKNAIDQCVENIKNKYYGKNPLCPTGPNLFGSVIAKDNLSENSDYLIGTFKNPLFNKQDNNSHGYYMNNEIFALYKPNGLKDGNPGFIGGNSYGKIWHERNVYV